MADVEYKFIDNTVLADEVIGHANISSISDGTLRGAVKKINTDLDGVKEHLGEVDKNIGNCTNILNLNKKSATSKGITFTYNADDTYSVSGALLETAQYCVFTIASIKLDGTYKFVGCPSGGGNSNYYLSFSNTGFESKDIGQGNIFTFTGEANVHIVITTHDTLNLVFKPMISTNLNAQYSDYVPYTGSTGKLNSDVAELNQTLSRKLLWSNTNTSSEFTQTTITLNDNIANYQRYEIIYRENTTTQLFKSSGIIDKDLSNITCNTVSYNTWRTNSAPNGTSISINGGRKQTAIGSATDDNTILIPYRVYGYKY